MAASPGGGGGVSGGTVMGTPVSGSTARGEPALGAGTGSGAGSGGGSGLTDTPAYGRSTDGPGPTLSFKIAGAAGAAAAGGAAAGGSGLTSPDRTFPDRSSPPGADGRANRTTSVRSRGAFDDATTGSAGGGLLGHPDAALLNPGGAQSPGAAQTPGAHNPGGGLLGHRNDHSNKSHSPRSSGAAYAESRSPRSSAAYVESRREGPNTGAEYLEQRAGPAGRGETSYTEQRTGPSTYTEKRTSGPASASLVSNFNPLLEWSGRVSDCETDRMIETANESHIGAAHLWPSRRQPGNPFSATVGFFEGSTAETSIEHHALTDQHASALQAPAW